MNYLVVDFITENWLYILLGLLGFILLSVFVNFIYYKFFNVRKSFKENLDDIKLVQFTTVIDYEEKTVEKYYLYDQVHKNATLSLEEFFVKFDKANYEKFNNWLRSITEYNDFDKTRRIEIVMYDNYNSRSVYLVELENYIAESKRYFLNFKDITKTAQIQRRALEARVEIEANPDLWTKCVHCDAQLLKKDIEDNQMVCPVCDYHFMIVDS